MCMENIATRPCVYSVFITPLTYSPRSVVRYILNLRGWVGGTKRQWTITVSWRYKMLFLTTKDE